MTMATIYKLNSTGEGVKAIQRALHLIPDGKGKDTRTENQKNALLILLLMLRELYPKARISGHRHFSPDRNGNGTVEPSEWIKECPCFDARWEYRKV